MGKLKQMHIDCTPFECAANEPLNCPMQYEAMEEPVENTKQ